MAITRRISLRSIFLIGLVSAAATAGCTIGSEGDMASSPTALSAELSGPERGQETRLTMDLVSEAFHAGEPIPERYTCDDENISPQLAWLNPPENSTHIALIVDDPDAPGGTWVHWLVFNIPVGIGGLDAALGSDSSLGGFGEAGLNSWGETSYGGPCPPSGTHRYFFRLYALDIALSFDSPPTISQLQDAMTGHILAEADLMGVFTHGN